MSVPVVADTLFAATTRGLLIYLDYHGLIKLHWLPLILVEVSRALVDTRSLNRSGAASLCHTACTRPPARPLRLQSLGGRTHDRVVAKAVFRPMTTCSSSA